jgi:hypothetical protein
MLILKIIKSLINHALVLKNLIIGELLLYYGVCNLITIYYFTKLIDFI